MTQSDEFTVPVLPCLSLEETLLFWRILGFEVTYQQKAPNPYAVVRRGGYELHFFGLQGLDPKGAFSTCLVVVPEVERLYETYSQNLRDTLGRLPLTGLPRISRMRPGQTRFTVTDPSGNSVIYIKRGGEDAAAAEDYKNEAQTPLQRAIAMALRLRDFKGDDIAAAKVLDVALAKGNIATSADRARALSDRIELAEVLGETDRARDCQAELERIPIAERA